jgi:hypothetical protein
MVVHEYCKSLFSMFHLFLRRMLQACVIWMLHMFSHICSKYFIWMLYMFLMVFKCFYKCFKCMFEVFYLSFLYVANVASKCFEVDRVLYMGYMWETIGARAVPAGGRRGRRSVARAPPGRET